MKITENVSEAPVPVVLMSYSHDTPELKRWVGQLATRLIENRVDVILDQWETGPGDDLPKFMERAVARADRVLMVCTEAYVHKADDGKGGVGYEAMIVTGELVNNLGRVNSSLSFDKEAAKHESQNSSRLAIT